METDAALGSELAVPAGLEWPLPASQSVVMRELLAQVALVAPTRSTVLLTGETGVGKGVVAREIHRLSNRAAGPFVSVHCGAIPDPLLESELFGYEKGAFTGANRRHLGRFELAQSGTIFLDEVGTISPAMQVKLLEVLQERHLRRVGGEAEVDLDLRVVVASNEDLAAKAESGAFRRDLFYRLNVFPLEVPPLRERLEDLPELVERFLARLNQSYGKGLAGIEPGVLAALAEYPWPGNIRELENIIERAYILETTERLSRPSFPVGLFTGTVAPGLLPDFAGKSLSQARATAVQLVEQDYLRKLMAAHHGRMEPAAAAAGVSSRQLRTLLARHGIDRRAYRKRK